MPQEQGKPTTIQPVTRYTRFAKHHAETPCIQKHRPTQFFSPQLSSQSPKRQSISKYYEA